MASETNETIARRFMLRAVQEWGQSERERIEATQALISAAGFDATATCSPVFGGIWPKQCNGPDGAAASSWLVTLTDTMPRGKFETECWHIEKALKARGEG